MASTARTTGTRSRCFDREQRVLARRRPSACSRSFQTAKFDETVEVHFRPRAERPPRRRSSSAGRSCSRTAPAREADGRRLRRGRQGARRRRRLAQTSSAPPISPSAIEEGFDRLRRRDRHARPDGSRRQARPHPRPARPDAEPEDRHGHDGRRRRPSATRRPASSSTAPTAARTSTSRSARRASTSASSSRTTPHWWRRSSARSLRSRRAATSGRSPSPLRWAPEFTSTPPQVRGIVEELEEHQSQKQFRLSQIRPSPKTGSRRASA